LGVGALAKRRDRLLMGERIYRTEQAPDAKSLDPRSTVQPSPTSAHPDNV
jgi:hypothetical protein